MDDYEPWLTPCDPDFDPEKCESAYALWAVKEEGEPVKFLEASITDNLDYPSGYWFFWRTISFSEETGRLIEGEWGGAGDICRADYVADMVLPGGAVFARVQGELDDGIPFDWEVRRPLDDCAKTRAAEAIRAGILALPLSASASIEAIPSPYKIDVSIVHGGTLTHDMARNLLVSAEHYYRDSALCGLLDNWNGLAVAQRALLVQTAKSMREDSPDEAFASLSRAIALIRATDERAGDVSDHTLAHNLLISGFEEMERDNTKLISRQISEGRLDIGEIARAFVGAMGRKTGAALDAALEGKHAGCYSRDVDALVFTDDDIDDYANMIEHGRPDLDFIQCREIASQAVTDWNNGHAMDGFTEFLYDYSDEHAPANGELLYCFDFNRYGEIAVNNGYVDLCETCYVDKRADWPALDEYSFEEIRDETVAEWRAHIAEGVVEKPVTPTDLARSASAAAATSAVIAASANQTAPKL